MRSPDHCAESAFCCNLRDTNPPPGAVSRTAYPISMMPKSRRREIGLRNSAGPEGCLLPRPARGRGVRHSQPLGRRLGPGLRGARLRSPGHHQLGLRPHAWAPRRQRHARRAGRAVAALDGRPTCRSRLTSRTATGPSPRTPRTRSPRRRGRSGRRLDRGLRPQRRDLRLRPCHRARDGGQRGGAAPRLPLHLHGPRREPLPRQPRPRRHDRPPAGLRAGRRRCPLRPGLRDGDQIRAVCEAVGKPVNVLAMPGLSMRRDRRRRSAADQRRRPA